MGIKDLSGHTYGKLTVIECVGIRNRYATWKCKCECGEVVEVRGTSLTNGHTTSCGCAQKEKVSRLMKKHGLSGSRLYRIYQHMVGRCVNKNEAGYENYGGRGISVCDEWAQSFKSFSDWALSNGYKDDLTLDRIEVDGNYEPTNCRWVTQKIQANNTRTNRILTYSGESHTMSEWADITGLSYNLIDSRIFRGWSVERTFTEPVHTSQRRTVQRNSAAI